MAYKKIERRPYHSKKETISRLSDSTQRTLKNAGVHLQEITLNKGNNIKNEPEYSTVKFQRLYRGYDMFENIGYIDLYIRRKYKIRNRSVIDLLLYLFPKGVFSIRDYYDVKYYNLTFAKIEHFIQLGFIEYVVKNKYKKDCVFRLTDKANDLVREYYHYVTGEIPIPTDDGVLSESHFYCDDIKNEIIKKLNKKPISTYKKSLWYLTKKN